MKRRKVNSIPEKYVKFIRLLRWAIIRNKRYSPHDLIPCYYDEKYLVEWLTSVENYFRQISNPKESLITLHNFIWYYGGWLQHGAGLIPLSVVVDYYDMMKKRQRSRLGEIRWISNRSIKIKHPVL